jgi:hypothetical protein
MLPPGARFSRNAIQGINATVTSESMHFVSNVRDHRHRSAARGQRSAAPQQFGAVQGKRAPMWGHDFFPFSRFAKKLIQIKSM